MCPWKIFIHSAVIITLYLDKNPYMVYFLESSSTLYDRVKCRSTKEVISSQGHWLQGGWKTALFVSLVRSVSCWAGTTWNLSHLNQAGRQAGLVLLFFPIFFFSFGMTQLWIEATTPHFEGTYSSTWPLSCCREWLRILLTDSSHRHPANYRCHVVVFFWLF